MIRSLYSGVTGLRNHQTRMDVISNNIANVNTTGFKGGRVNFQDMFNQTMRYATPPTDTTGSVNPVQIGLGMMVASISTNPLQGALQNTGRVLDMAIQGEGYFIIKQGLDADDSFYSRDGVLNIDSEGYLVNSNGFYVCDSDGEAINLYADLGDEGIDSLIISDLGQIFVNNEELAQRIGLATFNNPSGLERAGLNLFREGLASGEPVPGIAGEGELFTTRIASGFVEMSNVDLSEEFTNMIVTQRGYQANSRVITVSDSLLEELINLKR